MKKRILVINKFCPLHPSAGGAEKNLLRLFSKLNEHYDIYLLAAMFPGAQRREVYRGITIIRLGNRNSENIIRIHILIPILLRYYIKELKPNILFEDISVLPFFIPLLCPGIKKMVMIHGFNRRYLLSSKRYLFAFVSYITETLFLLLYRNELVITVSDWMRQELLRSHFKNVHTILNGVDENLFTLQKCYTPEPTVLFLGRLEKRKGVDLFLLTYELVKKSIPHVHYMIAGKDFSFGNAQLHRVLQYYRAHYTQNEISFFGFVSDEQKNALLQKTWLTVMPSHTEGYGIAAIEASATGTFVIANNVEGLQESVHQNESGVLVDCKKKTAFAEKIIQWLDIQKLTEKQIPARTWAKTHSWNKSVNELKTLIEHISEMKGA
ncbi:MAG: glycosyltransferase family 4 protein [Candidatus Paceibacterota bacterium]|jgi:glycosyltransferase involved in cell wall biosynthesis